MRVRGCGRPCGVSGGSFVRLGVPGGAAAVCPLLPRSPAALLQTPAMSGFDSFSTDFFQTSYSIDDQPPAYDYSGSAYSK